uniref:hypothetical protein n=1 Tax=Drechslerella dactyloides TaxID=74499 RepID=UPI0022FD4FA5|nr:hypothetical protein PNX16_mgp007 [Drechslerella dactyloides]WAN89844.1 hypothetical protein [Drechslerella dactyloides]
MGWEVRAIFQIELHQKDRVILEQIKSYFGVGKIYKQGKNNLQYRVISLEDLTNVIIPHFENIHLITQKRADFELFKQVVDLMNQKKTFNSWRVTKNNCN